MEKKRFYLYPILLLIKIYKYVLSPWTPPCRFHPTCSAYAEEAFKKFGVFKGGFLTLHRLLRCHPWGGSGFDPVVKESKKNSKLHPTKERCTNLTENKEL